MDRDLFPAIAEFLRGRRQLRSLQLVVHDEQTQHAVGFDASIWGTLPSLDGLRGLSMTYTADLSPGLASWLIPRGVTSLRLDIDHTNPNAGNPALFLNVTNFIFTWCSVLIFVRFQQLKHGIPPSLRFVGISDINVRGASVIVETAFPMVHVLQVADTFWTVKRKSAPSTSHAAPSFEMEEWPKRRAKYHATQWLESLGCEGALLHDPCSFSG